MNWLREAMLYLTRLCQNTMAKPNNHNHTITILITVFEIVLYIIYNEYYSMLLYILCIIYIYIHLACVLYVSIRLRSNIYAAAYYKCRQQWTHCLSLSVYVYIIVNNITKPLLVSYYYFIYSPVLMLYSWWPLFCLSFIFAFLDHFIPFRLTGGEPIPAALEMAGYTPERVIRYS